MLSQKLNPRVQFTKNALRQAFFTLLERKSLQSITVTDICAEADINRSTFYVHYKDIRSLIEEIEDVIIDNMKNYINIASEMQDPMQALLVLLRTIKSNTNMVWGLHKLFIEHSDPGFVTRVNSTIHEIFLKLWGNNNLNNSDEQEAVYSFIVGGNVALIVHWLKENTALDAEKITKLIETLSQGALRQYEH